MSTAAVQPYLVFGGDAEAAIEFYKSALGAELQMLMRFKDAPEPMPGLPEGYEGKVMHATLSIGQSVVMISDGCEVGSDFKGFSLSIGVKTEEEADKAFEALQDGAEIIMPLQKTFWSPKFGMLKDKFGVDWMVSFDAEPA